MAKLEPYATFVEASRPAARVRKLLEARGYGDEFACLVKEAGELVRAYLGTSKLRQRRWRLLYTAGDKARLRELAEAMDGLASVLRELAVANPPWLSRVLTREAAEALRGTSCGSGHGKCDGPTSVPPRNRGGG